MENECHVYVRVKCSAQSYIYVNAHYFADAAGALAKTGEKCEFVEASRLDALCNLPTYSIFVPARSIGLGER